MTDNPEIARASRSEIDQMIEWAAAEGWNPGLRDADCFFAAGPRGFWLAQVGGEFAACMSLVEYGTDFAFLGFYIARPDWRGRGIGYALWQTALDACDATTVGLDGVVAQQDNYRKSGFELAHRNVRYAGTIAGSASDNGGIVPVDATLAGAVNSYDAGCFPARRTAFLECWLTASDHIALAAMADGKIVGYGVIRPCREGFKIGPLFADDAETAERLFLALAAEANGATVILDPPDPNAAAVALCRKYDMAPVFETARMYRGPAPDLPLDRIFGITTFELG